MKRIALCWALAALTTSVHAQDAGVHAQDAGVRAPTRSQQAQELLLQGVQAYDAGHLEEALAKLREAHRLSPSPELSLHLGHVHERMGDAQNAMRMYRAAANNRSLAPAFRAEAQQRIVVMEDLARRQRDQIYAAPPTSQELSAEARTFFFRGVSMYRQRRYEAALQAFSAAYQFAHLPEIIFNLARTAEADHRRQDAIDYYVEYLRAAPQATDRAFVEERIHALRGD